MIVYSIGAAGNTILDGGFVDEVGVTHILDYRMIKHA